MIIGKEYIGISAGAVIQNDCDEFFLARRNQNARDDHGKWEFPGGSVSLNESREDAIKRMMFEKYGIEISVKKVLGVYDVIDKDQGDHWLSTTYICSILKGEPQNLIPDKCDKIGWFTIDEIKNLNLSRISQLNLGDIIVV